jgi:hypothetical protein
MEEKMPDPPAARGQVCAVVVTFHPDHDFPARLSRIVPQVAATFIVDNGSSVRCYRLVKRIAMYEQDKARKIYAVWQGWWDGLHGHMGPRRTPRKQPSSMGHHADP